MTSDAVEKGSTRLHRLPQLLEEIADVAGLSAALAIAQARGGTKVIFPAKCPDDHWLVAVAGREAADSISKHFSTNFKAGVTELVPLGPTRLYDRARFRALELLDAGQSMAQAARSVGVSSRAVEKWASTERKRRQAHSLGRSQRPKGMVSLRRSYEPFHEGAILAQKPQALLTFEVEPVLPDMSANVGPLPDIDLATLPLLLIEVASVAGLGAAIILGILKGGRVLHITDHAGRAGELIVLVGYASAEKLRAHFRAKHSGDVEILLPGCNKRELNVLAAWTAAAREDGCSPSEVAERLGISAPVVEHLCALTRATIGSGFSFRRDFPPLHVDWEL